MFAPHPGPLGAGPSFALLLALLWTAGCDRSVNREQLAKDVLKADPGFSGVLDRHRSLANRIGMFERELAVKRSTIEQSIAQMRRELSTSTATVKGKIDEVKKQIEPEQQRLEVALSMAEEEFRIKRFQRASLGRSMARLRKAGHTAKGAWTDAERARQEAQLREMARDAARLDQEIASLKEHVRLLKKKILLLRF